MPTRFWLFVRLFFAFSASYFSLLAQRISNQKKCTPTSAFILRYSVCRAAIKNSLLRSSNSCLPKTPVNPALLGAADGDPEHHATATVSEMKRKESGF